MLPRQGRKVQTGLPACPLAHVTLDLSGHTSPLEVSAHPAPFGYGVMLGGSFWRFFSHGNFPLVIFRSIHLLTLIPDLAASTRIRALMVLGMRIVRQAVGAFFGLPGPFGFGLAVMVGPPFVPGPREGKGGEVE